MKISRHIINIVILLIFFVLGTNCSSYFLDSNDIELIPYQYKVAKILDEKLDNIDHISLSFRTLQNNKSSVIGMCFYPTVSIYIDPTFWYKDSRTEKEKLALILHEYGHCYCYVEHDNRINKNKLCPISLMQDHLPSNSCLEKYWNEYIIDLKSRCK